MRNLSFQQILDGFLARQEPKTQENENSPSTVKADSLSQLFAKIKPDFQTESVSPRGQTVYRQHRLPPTPPKPRVLKPEQMMAWQKLLDLARLELGRPLPPDLTQVPSDFEVKALYRRLLKKLHPDLNPGPQEHIRRRSERLQEVTAAYEEFKTAA